MAETQGAAEAIRELMRWFDNATEEEREMGKAYLVVSGLLSQGRIAQDAEAPRLGLAKYLERKP